jgi:ATP-dependent RNA helicase DDX31/DBP7
LLFLQPIESDYLRDLELHGVSLKEYPLQKVLDSFPLSQLGMKNPYKKKPLSLDMHPWILFLQRALESFVSSQVHLIYMFYKLLFFPSHM